MLREGVRYWALRGSRENVEVGPTYVENAAAAAGAGAATDVGQFLASC